MKKIVDVAAAVLVRPDGAFLLGQRAPDTFYPGYWEFPGGKVEPGETPLTALGRELHEELGIEPVRVYPWIVRQHVYEHAHVRLHFFRVLEWRGEVQDHIHAALTWQRIDAPMAAPMLPANGPVLRALALPPLYAITHAGSIGVERQLSQIEAALQAGVRLIQVREPDLPPAEHERFAQRAVALAGRYGARALINGDRDLARRVDADGIHLKSRQLMQTAKRPEFPLVGASCHTAAELVRAAELELDFAVLGAVVPTASHPEHAGLGWDAFAGLVRECPLPVYAIGGMTLSDIEPAWSHGAQGIAAIRGSWDGSA